MNATVKTLPDGELRRDPESGSVAAVQLFDVSPRIPMQTLMRQYLAWLRFVFRGLVSIRPDDVDGEIAIRFLGIPTIRLACDDRSYFRIRYRVSGGWLAKPGGTFEFTRSSEGVTATLRGFRPRLPWWLYRRTHGPAHRRVMCGFAAHVAHRGNEG